LHVVLAAQRMEARARPPNLAGDERQADEAAGIVGAVDVLRDAHAPEDDRGPGRRVEPRDGADRVGIDAADRGHRLRRERLYPLCELGEALGEALDILLVVEL